MYDYAIVGSGVAGCTLAKELSGKKIVIEKGEKPKYVGEGKNVLVNYVVGLGGSAVFSVGNAIKLKIKGYKIEKDIYDEIFEELNIKEADNTFLNDIDKEFLNFGFKKTPKFIDFEKCNKCGKCASKICNAKWTPLNFLKQSDADIITNFNIIKIEKEKEYFIIYCKNKKIKAKNIVLSAGAINSARILKSLYDYEEIGKNLFVDTFITVGGILKDSYLNEDVPMLVYKDYDDFILATHYSSLLYKEIKKEHKDIRSKDIVGLMIKIKDEMEGKVLKNNIKKEISKEDLKLLVRGISKATKYINKLGVEEIYSTIPRGSHPSGTLSFIKDFMFEDIYVCDSSLFKEPLGKPPVVSIIALAKKLSRELS
ncbi:hypothetical protein ACPB8Q_07655 [Methanocaldococcus indicus]|uniref:hypothetical protein n=1 Tax=Methanocaldococcus indicus TaxID=213231 RepID=UPI003C6CEFD3